MASRPTEEQASTVLREKKKAEKNCSLSAPEFARRITLGFCFQSGGIFDSLRMPNQSTIQETCSACAVLFLERRRTAQGEAWVRTGPHRSEKRYGQVSVELCWFHDSFEKRR